MWGVVEVRTDEKRPTFDEPNATPEKLDHVSRNLIASIDQ